MGNVSLIISVFTLLFGSGVLVSLWNTIKGINTLKLGMQSILRDRLLQVHAQYKNNGHISYQEMNNILNMYDMYHKLGANGVMDEIIEEIRSIPIVG